MELNHRIEFEVRDYECDLQGIVNNANYFHYYEHARHKMAMDTLDLDFSELHKKGVDLVLAKAEISYKNSLTSLDKFVVESEFVRVGKIKFQFKQKIVREDNKLVSSAVFVVACVVNGRPGIIPELAIIPITKIIKK